jgi:predicted dehydrogenase
MTADTYGHTPVEKAFDQADVYGIGYDEARAARPLVRLAICGTGGVAQSKFLPAIHRLRTLWEPVQVTAIAERSQLQGEKTAALYNCRWHSDWRRMLEEEDVNGVIVAAPDELHAEMAMACIEQNLPVLVEKPITRSLADSHALCVAADQRNLLLMTVANKRYSPPYFRARQHIQDGAVRNPAMFAGKFNLGYDYVDMLEGGTIHLYDLCRYLMGDVATLRAVGVNRYDRNQLGYPFDNAVCQLEFASGAVGALYTSCSALSLKPWERVEVYGNHAWLAVEDQVELRVYDSEEGPARSWTPVVPNTLLFDEEFGGYMGLVENFCQAIRGAETPLVTGWDGHRSYELAVATHLSMARQGEVIHLPLPPAEADAACQTWLNAHRRATV